MKTDVGKDSRASEVIKPTKEDLEGEKPTEQKSGADIAEDVEQGGSTGTIKRLEQLTGVGPALAAKLREAGYNVMSLATGRPDIIAAEVRESYTVIRAACNQAKEVALAKMKVYTADEFDKRLKERQYFIPTGCDELDTILGGGIPTYSITGSSARFSSGKTQIGFAALLHVLAMVYVCLQCRRIYKVPPVIEYTEKGEYIKKGVPFTKGETCPYCNKAVVKAKAVMIETEQDTFHLDRLKQMAYLNGLKNIIWSNLFVLPAEQIPTIKAQYLQYKMIQRMLEGYEEKLSDGKVITHEPEPIVFVDIDSFNAKLRAGWGESQELPKRTRELAEHFALMDYLASTYNIGWYLTHQVIAGVRPEQQMEAKMKFLDEYYPAGGDYDLHSVNNWLALANVTKSLVEAELFDSSWRRKAHCYFKLTEKGLENGTAEMEKRKAMQQAQKEKEKPKTVDPNIHPLPKTFGNNAVVDMKIANATSA